MTDGETIKTLLRSERRDAVAVEQLVKENSEAFAKLFHAYLSAGLAARLAGLRGEMRH